jgi:hypothetical protein
MNVSPRQRDRPTVEASKGAVFEDRAMVDVGLQLERGRQAIPRRVIDGERFAGLIAQPDMLHAAIPAPRQGPEHDGDGGRDPFAE